MNIREIRMDKLKIGKCIDKIEFKCYLKKIAVPVRFNFVVTVFAKDKKEAHEKVGRYFKNMILAFPLFGDKTEKITPQIKIGKGE